MRFGVYPRIMISLHPQKSNERKLFGTDVLHAFEADFKSLKEIRFLNSAVDEVACDYKWVQEKTCKSLHGKNHHVILTDTK